MYNELEHTADYSVRLFSSDLVGLFEQAVAAVEDLCVITTGEMDDEIREITIEASDLEILLIEWFEELLYSIEVDQVFWRPIKVGIEGNVLKAVVQVFPLESIERVIKAVTFHQLQVLHKADRWEAQVVFDV